MPPTPRKTIEPDFIADLECPICGQDALSIKSLANYPDFVTCGNCDSQFAAEQGGERIMYGKIPASYPRTRRFALQQWAWAEAIARRAAEERPESSGVEPSTPAEPPPPVGPTTEEAKEEAPEEPDLPAPTELQPDQLDQDPTPIEPESAVQEEPISEELSPAAEVADSTEPMTETEPEEPLLESPDEEFEAPTPTSLEPEATVDDPALSAAEEEAQEEDFLAELSAGFDEETTDITFEDEIEDELPPLTETEQELDQPPAPEDLEPEATVEDPTLTATEQETQDEDFLAELEEETTGTAFDQEAEAELPPPDAIEGEPEVQEPLAPADEFEQTLEDPTPIAPESAQQDEPMLEEFAEEAEAEPTLPSDWTTEEEPDALPDPEAEDFFGELEGEEEPEADFSFFGEEAEAEVAGDWEDSEEEDSEGIFTPPFGEEESEEAADMPEDFEPAPPMPNWLDQSDQVDADETSEEDDIDAIDFTGLSDEAAAEPSDTSFGEEEDLLASLWGDEDDEDDFDIAETEDEDVDLDDELAGFAGLGALSDEAEAEAGADPFGEDAADLWAEESAPEESTAPPAAPEGLEAEQDLQLTEEQQREEIARAQWAGHESEEEAEVEPLPDLEEAAQEGQPVSLEAEEPPPGERYRVVLQDHEASFPEEICAHCSQSPTVGRLSIAATVYRGAGVGERQAITYRIPVCEECRDRAKARSDERQTAQLQAHLISVLIALILVVSALAFRLVDFQDRIGIDLAILFLLAGMGYAIPVAFLLIRASRIGKPADAKYVESTLRVPGDTEGTETAFEFRNERYARYFQQENEEKAVSGVNKVRERQYEQENP